MDAALKLLVVTSWAPPMIGGPRNLYNLLSQFSPDSYVILTSYQSMASAGIDPSSWLPGQYLFIDRSQSIVGGAALSNPTEETAIRAAGRVLKPKVPFAHVLAATSPMPTVRKIAAMTRQGVSAVRKAGTTRILGISDHGPALIAARSIARRTGIPYALYLYDLYRGNYYAPFDRILARLVEGTLLRGAHPAIVTNEETESYYRMMYGPHLRLAVVHNSVFAEDYAPYRAPYRPVPPYSIVFTGHVYWPQRQSVMNMVHAMDQLLDLPVHLDLYTPWPDQNLEAMIGATPRVRILSAPAASMPAIQSQATLLFLPFAWNTPSPQIVATASPGKLTDYLAAARPLLIHAPEYAFVTRYARRHDLGLVVDTNDIRMLAKVVRQFLQDPSVGQRFASNAFRVFTEQYDARKNAAKLMTLLS